MVAYIEQWVVPGYGLPLGYLPPSARRFPVVMGMRGKDWAARTLLVREVCMLRFIEDVTNKAEWWRKVRDAHVAVRWQREAQQMDWGQYRKHGDFTRAMALACMQELRRKAALYEETGLVPVLDYSACVVKSDRLVPEELRARLQAVVRPLEEVAEEDKDWHPGSDGTVLDLVHPSLWPLLYGRSRILRNRRIGVNECLDLCGRGFLVPRPHERDDPSLWDWRSGETLASVSTRFQWLPCDVTLAEDGSATIESYVNNLHPRRHAALYPALQSFIEKALPAWDLIYRWVQHLPVQRLRATRVGRRVPVPDAQPERDGRDGGEDGRAPEAGGEDEDGGADDGLCPVRDDAVGETTGQNRGDDEAPPAEEDGEHDETDDGDDVSSEPSRVFGLSANDIKSRGFFNRSARIQVIVKLANIHLTPDKPVYDGGSWHVEGQLNEHICATALFYYDSDNITETRLAFRAPANADQLGRRLKYEQGELQAIERAFAIRSRSDTLQDVGSVLTRPGRAVFFPNLWQHRVQPFRLADASRPGHRKILALFLVDPAIPVISTANVPPQQRHWCGPHAAAPAAGAQLPPEVADLVLDNMDALIGLDEARRLRLELMRERTVMRDKTESKLQEVEWSFCEH